jgi:RepB DNA-primase from phage plasmid
MRPLNGALEHSVPIETRAAPTATDLALGNRVLFLFRSGLTRSILPILTNRAASLSDFTRTLSLFGQYYKVSSYPDQQCARVAVDEQFRHWTCRKPFRKRIDNPYDVCRLAKPGERTIRQIRHTYLDLDEEAGASLQAIRNCGDVPAPNFVLDTSPGKHQVVWRVEGLDTHQAESLLRALASQYGGDPGATDIPYCFACPDTRTENITKRSSCERTARPTRSIACRTLASRKTRRNRLVILAIQNRQLGALQKVVAANPKPIGHTPSAHSHAGITRRSHWPNCRLSRRRQSRSRLLPRLTVTSTGPNAPRDFGLSR